MDSAFQLDAVRAAIRSAGVDAWLFYDFRGSDPIAYNVLGIDTTKHYSRRWYYFVPAQGEPVRLVHAIESGALDALPGEKRTYLSWQSLDAALDEMLGAVKRVAMQYSPGCEVPYVSRVDAGTVDAVRKRGCEVVSSADLCQVFDATLSDDQIASHRRAADTLGRTVTEAFDKVGHVLGSGGALTEAELLAFVEDRLRAGGLITDHPAIIGVNDHAADPHFEVSRTDSAAIRPGDLLLLDVWAKEDRPGSIYADITWCAFVGWQPPQEVADVFAIVARARDAAIARADEAFRKGEEICGYEVDRACRAVIVEAGYGDRFIHRTGHSIHELTHGNGANIDDLETHDTRRLLPRTLFSIEPGIYLPGKFGIRSEVDVYHTGSGAEVTGPGCQKELVVIPV